MVSAILSYLKFLQSFDNIANDMSIHLKEEEDVLFPALKRADKKKKTDTAPSIDDLELISNSLKNLLREHEEIGEAVHKISHLSQRIYNTRRWMQYLHSHL